jgi:hypothetical protein
MRAWRLTKRLMLTLWVAFILRGLWYSAMMPAWEGYDEPYHFALLQYLAAERKLTPNPAVVSLEVQHSLHLLPIPWEMQFQHIPQPLVPYDVFWRLPQHDRDLLTSDARRISPAEGSESASEWIPNYEFQQMPLSYWVFSVPMRWMRTATLLSRLVTLRCLSVLLASMVIPLSYLVAQRVFNDDGKALGVTALVLLLPELMVDVARVSNESLGLVLMTIALLCAMKAVETPRKWGVWMGLGLTLGLGLLTKAYFLITLPALLLIALFLALSPRSHTTLKAQAITVTLRTCTTLGIMLALAGRWYWRVNAATGSWSGQGDAALLQHLSLFQKLQAIPRVNWKGGAASILLPHVWFGGWSFLRLPLAWYIAAAVPITVGMAGAVGRLERAMRSSETRLQVSQIVVLVAFYLCFWAGLAYDILIFFLFLGVSATTGWYLYCLVVAEIVLLVWGLEAFLPTKLIVPVLCASVALMDLYGMHAFMLPYYTGLSVHVARQVPGALMLSLSHLPTVFARLAINKPTWLGAPLLVTLWLLYINATLGTLAVCVAVSKSSRLRKTQATDGEHFADSG